MVHALEQVILDICQSHFDGIGAVYLFGSHAQGDARPDSDLDVALLFDHHQAKALGDLALSDGALKLGRSLGCHVDLVNLRAVSTVFQYQIITTGKMLYANPSVDPYLFEGLTLSLYQKLKEERSLVEASIRISGEIYAP